jgi:gamma-glutamyl hercynylcysteine S-oxide hydrolase
MCRHLAYIGASASLQGLLVDPPHSLYTQSYAPRRQRHGVVNADGFGAGWYLPGRTAPVRYRRSQPIWSDQSFASLAPTIGSGCVLAAVRSATAGFPADESCAAPFTYDRWLFSHNGAVDEPQLLRKALHDKVSWVPDALAPVDSAVLFGLAVARWEAGDPLAGGLAQVVRQAAPIAGGRLTLLAADGDRIAGVTWGQPLYVRIGANGVLLAAEPDDDEPDWQEVPDQSVVAVDGPPDVRVSVTPLNQKSEQEDV